MGDGEEGVGVCFCCSEEGGEGATVIVGCCGVGAGEGGGVDVLEEGEGDGVDLEAGLVGPLGDGVVEEFRGREGYEIPGFIKN